MPEHCQYAYFAGTSLRWLLPCLQQSALSSFLLLMADTGSILQGLKLCAADHARQAISADGTRPTLAQRLAIGGLAGAIAQARL